MSESRQIATRYQRRLRAKNNRIKALELIIKAMGCMMVVLAVAVLCGWV